jgi:phosphonate transport system ATP-binding protein
MTPQTQAYEGVFPRELVSPEAATHDAHVTSLLHTADSPTPPSFELQDVGRRWQARVALEQITLSIKPGERIALVGPSGSGKSTFLRILNGTLRATSGTVRVDGVDVEHFTRRALLNHRKRFGIIEQGSHLVPQLSVHHNVLAGRLPHWAWYRTLASLLVPLERKQVAENLARVGLADRQWDTTASLSGGQQQRVAIARALASSPSVILADEPTASLDPATAAEVTRLLLETARRSITLIFCTHWIGQLNGLMDRVIGIRQGRVAIDAPASEVTDADLQSLYSGTDERC